MKPAQPVAAPSPARPATKPATDKPAAPATDKPAAKPAGATLGPGAKVRFQLVALPIPALLQYSKVEVPFAKEVIPQRSNGRVEMTTATWAERNLTGNEMIRLIRQGQVEASGGGVSYVAGDVPLIDVVDLAGLNPSLERARKVMDAVTPVVNKEPERFGVQVVGSVPYPAQVIGCNKPIKDLADLKGRKIRTFGVTLNDFVAAIGAQPVSITFAETYSALERGVAECGITGTARGNANKWHEVTTRMYTLTTSWSLGAYYVNVGWGNKLDPDVRQFLEVMFKEMTDKQWELANELNQVVRYPGPTTPL